MEYRLLVLGASHPDDTICIRPGLQSWATYGVDLDIARLRVVVAAARRYYGHLRSAGLAKESEPAPTTAAPTVPTTHVRSPAEGSAQPTDQAAPGDLGDPREWTLYSRADLRNHDTARRAWLRAFAQGCKFPAFRFTMHGQRSGYYQAGIPAGEDGWTGFLERAIHYDVYCCFVAAYTPQVPLGHYLNDAAQRGEIRLDQVEAWTPRSHYESQ